MVCLLNGTLMLIFALWQTVACDPSISVLGLSLGELCVLPPLEVDDPLAPPKNGTLMRIGGFEWYAS